MTKGGSLKSIEGARKNRKSLETRVKELEALVKRIVNIYDGELAKANERTRELVRANNAASVLLATVEEFLDARFPNWDEGKREAMKERAVLLAERQALVIGISKNIPNDERAKAAERLLAVSRELGTESTDVPVVVSAFVKNRDAKRALEIVNFARETKIEIAPEYAALFAELEAKVGKLAAAPE